MLYQRVFIIAELRPVGKDLSAIKAFILDIKIKVILG